MRYLRLIYGALMALASALAISTITTFSAFLRVRNEASTRKRVGSYQLIRKIGEVGGLSAEDAYSLCSVAADVHVTQLVNIAKGVHVMIAKELLKR